jgi:hypothetical protein
MTIFYSTVETVIILTGETTPDHALYLVKDCYSPLFFDDEGLEFFDEEFSIRSIKDNIEYSKNDSMSVGSYCVVVSTKFRINDESVRGPKQAERYTQDNIIEWPTMPDRYGYVDAEFIIISDRNGKVLNLKEEQKI